MQKHKLQLSQLSQLSQLTQLTQWVHSHAMCIMKQRNSQEDTYAHR